MIWLVLLFQANTLIYAQNPSFVQLHKAPEYFVEAGEQQYISLSFLIKEGYHIQASQVKDENLIPTVLSFDVLDSLKLGDPVFPKTVEFKMKGQKTTWSVYKDILEINVPVKIIKPGEKEVFSINGKLYYQACDDYKCYFPRNLKFIMKINIKK
ncbi:protein-disulfide reductase DsbD domain-containing protein [Marivirga sp.]|uniref:protein-disulfide reductase DsbD domain-containing protein n=1 Tax=Marivirga sp. TaxID=2018662 RepID=UPI0025D26F52|nr:protein-disulfide reductase DsbD domain-containing protein [Marivirga sp.]